MSNLPSSTGNGQVVGGVFTTVVPSNNIPAGAAPSTDALFAALLELRWKDVSIPYTRLETRLRQDLAIHKFADRDGAYVEGTGRAPLEITAHLPLFNGLTAGANETWQRPLYPLTWRNLFRVCAQNTSGVLQHPELGSLTCKVETLTTVWDAAVRGGVACDISWIETDDSGVDLDNDLATSSPLSNIVTAGDLLDGEAAQVATVSAPHLPTFSVSFSDMAFAIRGVIDQTTILQQSFAGQINAMVYQCQALEDSLDQVGNQNALNWPINQQCEIAKSSCYDLKKTLLTKQQTVGLYTTQKDATFAQISNIIGADIGDLMTLNPAYVQSPVLPAGSVVRYYVQGA
jgi:hypothetical protein